MSDITSSSAVTSGATTASETVASGGTVTSGTSAADTTVSSGASVTSGTTTSNTTVSSGGTASVTGTVTSGASSAATSGTTVTPRSNVTYSYLWYGPPASIGDVIYVADTTTLKTGIEAVTRELDGVLYVNIKSTSELTMPSDVAVTGPELSMAVVGTWFSDQDVKEAVWKAST